jgi:TIR domain
VSQRGLIFVQSEHFGKIHLPYADYPAEIYLRACGAVNDPRTLQYLPDFRQCDFFFFWDDGEYVLFVSEAKTRRFPTHVGEADFLPKLKARYGISELLAADEDARDLSSTELANDFFAGNGLKPGPVIAGRFTKLFGNASRPNARELQPQYWDAGAGILVEYAHRRAQMAAKARIFLSHRGADKKLVRDVSDTLELIGVRTWLDEEAMPAGTPIVRALGDGMSDCLAAAFFISDKFRDEAFIRKEVDAALHQQVTNPSFRIIPLVLTDHGGTDELVPKSLQVLRWVSVADTAITPTILRALPPELQSLIKYTTK